MKFDVEKLKQMARPMTSDEKQEIENRDKNRDWLSLSAKFALLVRHILRTEKITQTELATRMGVSCAQITKIISGKENLGLQTIAKVEKALGRELIHIDSIEDMPIAHAEQHSSQLYAFTVTTNVKTGKAESQDIVTYSSFSDNKILV